jgi:hypothetical protein
MNIARDGAAASRDSGPDSGQPAASSMAEPDQLPGIISGLSRQNSVYRRMMAVCERIADAAMQGADAAELTRIFAATAGKTVILLDPEFRPQAQAGSATPGPIQCWEPDDASVVSMLRVLAAERKPLRVPPVPGSALPCGCLATPVMVDDAVLAYLLVLDETVTEADDVDLVITSYAAILFALTLAREQTSLQLGRRYQGAILDSLVSGHFLDGSDARRKARSLGVGDAEPFRVAVARASGPKPIPGPGRPDGRVTAEEALNRLAGSMRHATVIRGPELVMLLPEQPRGDRPDHLSDGMTAGASRDLFLPPQAAGNQLTCGLSEPTERPELAPQALLQAQHAIDVGIRIGRAGQTICYSELGIYRLLLQTGNLPQLWQFAMEVLGPLVDYDAGHKVDLLSTLSIYLNQHESLKQTARVLRIHVNTVSYRIQRIEQLTSLDLANPDHRLSAHVAAKIIESRQATG